MSRSATFPVVVGVAVMALLVFQGIIPESEAKKSKSKGGKLSNNIPSEKGAKYNKDFLALPPFILETVNKFLEAQKTTLINKLSASEKNYVGVVNKCAEIIKLCPLTTISASVCSLACLFDQFPHLRHTIYLINDVTLQMCSFTETVFDGMMRNFNSDIRTVEQYLNLHHAQILGGGEGHVVHAAEALNFQIIKLSNLTSMDGLKVFLGSIYASNAAAKVANIGFNDRDVLNDVCVHVDYSDSTQRLAEEMISKPTLADILLDGYFSLSHIAPLGSFGPVAPFFEATMSVMRALTGVECGLLDFVATGTTIDCSKIVGKKRVNAKPSKSVRPDEGDPICGVKMDIPPVELGQKFPQIYPFNVLDKVDVYDYIDPYASINKGDKHKENIVSESGSKEVSGAEGIVSEEGSEEVAGAEGIVSEEGSKEVAGAEGIVSEEGSKEVAGAEGIVSEEGSKEVAGAEGGEDEEEEEGPDDAI